RWMPQSLAYALNVTLITARGRYARCPGREDPSHMDPEDCIAKLLCLPKSTRSRVLETQRETQHAPCIVFLPGERCTERSTERFFHAATAKLAAEWTGRPWWSNQLERRPSRSLIARGRWDMKDTTLSQLGGICSILLGMSIIVVGVTYLPLPPAQQQIVGLYTNPGTFLESVANTSTLLTV